jgi:hypothetical protein
LHIIYICLAVSYKIQNRLSTLKAKLSTQNNTLNEEIKSLTEIDQAIFKTPVFRLKPATQIQIPGEMLSKTLNISLHKLALFSHFMAVSSHPILL